MPNITDINTVTASATSAINNLKAIVDLGMPMPGANTTPSTVNVRMGMNLIGSFDANTAQSYADSINTALAPVVKQISDDAMAAVKAQLPK